MTDTGRLWAAVDELTRAVPGQVTRDDGTRVRLDAVSLWDQLVGSASQSGSSHASGKPGSRPPVALAALALRLEAQELVRSTLNLMREEHRYDFAKDLRRVVSNTVTLSAFSRAPAEIEWWTEKIAGWSARIRVLLGEAATVRRVPGHCITCGTDKLPELVLEGDEWRTYRRDVLLIDNDDWGQTRVTCQACGEVYRRGIDLDLLLSGMDQIASARLDAQAIARAAAARLDALHSRGR